MGLRRTQSRGPGGKVVRNKFADVFYDIAKDDPRQVMIVADISPAGSIERFRTDFPERFINTGVAEQIMIGMAAGLAIGGYRPWCYTIATFALYRPFEFVRDDLAYQQLPVVVVGIGGGLAYSTLGATHHAMEDVAVAAAIPGLTILTPSDPLETEAATRWLAASMPNGPVYLRLGKAGEPNLTGDSPDKWEPGHIRQIRSSNGDHAILTYGTALKIAVDAADQMASKPAVFSCCSIRPVPFLDLAWLLKSYRVITVVEEMVTTVGLGVQLQAMASSAGYGTEINRWGLEPAFKHVYGSHADLLKAHRLTAEGIARGY